MIKVLFFGQLKDQLGVAGIEISIEHEVNVSQLVENIIQAHPQWASALHKETVLVAVDQVMAKADTLVSRAAEVAFFPPVTGG
ncbi:MAG: molybdopterin converting factor subunit 1 [Oceanospirillaceae bacterium]|jgi:molybdopterin synthase sulfur carrier subunit|nr:molybdopterin converting factor subunit 1 [Oceanospirillaceae bacterium]MBT4997773.1 molybdopterin converting factor subunit 1 [Oceanospirillaceae bacterium]MBT5629638.1 molybdopterin converting factor subunit 1 [Oceanospirillaceae bacterium]MBT6101094.1 molybdopterin converting factor subunit 1 [Oceanospirillaceae bacterium]MBT7673509.1 molybdopterin converting factor subunit 1 [Oceanospirillaceae bacterium]|tara:strand:+ start:548 stop:796 length:249 start_codon:yes stop_codon:yes gene_type:complete